jgi:hypothetical protein
MASGNSCKNLRAIQRSNKKGMAILTRFWTLADQTSSSPCCDYLATPRITTSGNSCKILSAIQWWDQKLWSFYSLLKSGRPDLLVTELRFYSNTMENGLCKLLQKFKRDPTVESKVMCVLTRYSILAHHTSSSPSNDSIATQGKRPPETRANIWARSNGG